MARLAWVVLCGEQPIAAALRGQKTLGIDLLIEPGALLLAQWQLCRNCSDRDGDTGVRVPASCALYLTGEGQVQRLPAIDPAGK